MGPLASTVFTGRIFPGLRPFEEQDAVLFFGRDEQTDGLLRRLDDTRVLGIVGLSGSGKSSLVRAGLLPALRRGHLAGAGARWRIAVMRPGSTPLSAMARALDDALGPLDERLEILRSGRLGLLDVSRYGRGPEENLLIVVDQFEEIFRLGGSRSRSAEAAEFVQLLLAAVQEYEPRYRVYVVITMRSDYLGECAQFSGLPEALNESQYLVPRMTTEQLREAIEGPAALGGVEVQPELVEHLLEQTGTDPDELPVLQHLLMRIWEVREKRDGGSRIGLAQLEQVGGWHEALTKHADAVLTSLNDKDRLVAKRLFQRLTEKGQFNRESRRPTVLQELASVAGTSIGTVKNVLEPFRREGCNFVMSSTPDLTAESVIDISHESLIRRWKTLSAWVDEETRSAEWYRRVQDGKRLFERKEKGRLSGPELHSALLARTNGHWNRAWADRYDPDFDRAMTFLDNSRRTQRGRRIAGWILALAVVGLVLGFVFIQAEANKNERSLRLRNSFNAPDPLLRTQLVTALADAAAPQDLTLFSHAAIAPIPFAELAGHAGPLISAAFRPSGDVVTTSSSGRVRWWSATGRAGTKGFDVGRALNVSLEETAPATGDIAAVAFSPDAQWLAAASRSGAAWIGRSDGSAEFVTIPPPGTTSTITALAFTPDGRQVVAGYNDYQVQVWSRDGAPGPIFGQKSGHRGPISGIAFVPDGKQLATASWDGTVKIWRLDDPREPLRTFGAERNFPAANGVSFSPDGAWLLCAFRDKARVWRSDGLGTATELPDGEVTAALFSHDADPLNWKVITGTADGTVRLRSVLVADVQGNKFTLGEPLLFSGHHGSVRSFAFSTDGAKVVTTSDDATARIWWTIPREPRLIGKHERRVESVTFSPDGTRIVSAADDSTARIWTLNGSPAPTSIIRHANWVRSAAFSADGGKIVTASEDGKSWIGDATGRRLTEISGGEMLSAAFDPTGNRVATSTKDGTVTVWNIGNSAVPPRPETTLRANQQWVWTVAFSRDGERIVTASADHTARVWDARSGKLVATLTAHSDRVLSAAFSPDGHRIVTASADGSARIWKQDNNKWTTVVEVKHGGAINHAEFSADGGRVVTASDDGTVRIWAADSGLEVLVLPHGVSVRAAAFNQNAEGSEVVTGAADGNVRLWRVTVPGLIQYLKNATSACAPPDMRVQFLGESERQAQNRFKDCEDDASRNRAPN
jgi:WD40 repeat protein